MTKRQVDATVCFRKQGHYVTFALLSPRVERMCFMLQKGVKVKDMPNLRSIVAALRGESGGDEHLGSVRFINTNSWKTEFSLPDIRMNLKKQIELITKKFTKDVIFTIKLYMLASQAMPLPRRRP